MTKNAVVLVIVLLYLVVGIALAIFWVIFTNFLGWLALLLAVFSGVIPVERLAVRFAKMLKEPRLRIVSSSRVLREEGSEGEYLDIYLLIKNTGGTKATDCDIQAVVKGVTHNSFFLNNNPFSLKANGEEKLHFQQIIKSEHRTRALTEERPKLEMGRIYEYEITFSGANLEDKKKHTLKLDLSSWENINVILAC